MTNENRAAVVSSARLLTRAEAARALGVSKSTLRRREGSLLKPIKGPRGVHLFDETEVRAVVVRQRRGVRSEPRLDGDVAADVFERLDGGVHPVDIVKELRIDPDTIEQLQAQWIRLRAMVVLTSDDLESIEALRLSGEFPITSAAVLLSNLRESLNEACVECHKSVPTICRRCVKARIVRLRERAADEDDEGERVDDTGAHDHEQKTRHRRGSGSST